MNAKMQKHKISDRLRKLPQSTQPLAACKLAVCNLLPAANVLSIGSAALAEGVYLDRFKL